MTEAHKTRIEEASTPCVLCRSEIPFSAGFCTQCSSFQDWRRHFKTSSTTLALLVALFAVLGSSITAVSSVWPDSESEIEISRPVFYGTAAHILMTNDGDKAALVEDAFLQTTFLDRPVKFEPMEPESRMVSSGSSQLALSPQIYLSPVDALDTMSRIRSENPTVSGGEAAGEFAVAVRNSDGRIDEIKVEVSYYELFKFVNAHAQFCLNQDPRRPVLLDPCQSDESEVTTE